MNTVFKSMKYGIRNNRSQNNGSQFRLCQIIICHLKLPISYTGTLVENYINIIFHKCSCIQLYNYVNDL